MTSSKSGEELKNELLARLEEVINGFVSSEKLCDFEKGQLDAFHWIKQIVEEEM